MVPPVLGIGRLVMPPIQGFLLAVADRFDPLLRNSQVIEEFGRFIGAFLAERQIVFRGASLITVPFDHERIRRMLQICLCALLKNRLALGLKVVCVVIKIDIWDLDRFGIAPSFSADPLLALSGTFPLAA